MAETFVNTHLNASTTGDVLYTCPASTTAIVISIQAANTLGTDATVTARVDDEGTTEYVLVSALTVPANAAINIIAGKLVLDAGDEIYIEAGTAAAIDAVGAILEIT